MIFFFFQAEDGIRDVAVTGVQTCALPICSPTYAPAPNLDFFGNARKTNNAVDAGAVEFAATTGGGGGGGGQGTLSIISATNGTLGSVLGIPTLTFTIPAPRAPVISMITVQNIG